MTKYLAFLALLLLPATALAQPIPTGRAEEYTRAAGQPFGHEVAVTNTTATVRTSTAVDASPFNRPKLFPFGSLVTVACQTADVHPVFCWVQEDGVTLTQDGYVVDATSSGPRTEGPNGCFRILAGTYRDSVLHESMFARATGEAASIRHRSCTSATAGKGDIGAPCDADADCYYVGSTCSTGTKPKGAYLAHIASGNATCFVTIEK